MKHTPPDAAFESPRRHLCPRPLGRGFVTALALMLMLLVASQASASAIYTYTGTTFGFVSVQGPTAPADPYTTGDRVSLVMELPAALPNNLAMAVVVPSTFSVADGVNLVTQANATYSRFLLSTDGGGNIVAWEIVAEVRAVIVGGGSIRQIITNNSGASVVDWGFDILCGPGSNGVTCVLEDEPHYDNRAVIRDDPGTWRVEATPPGVPEPTSMVLLGTGIIGLVARRRRLH